MFGGASLMLCGNLALARETSPGEMGEIGAALADCLDTLPTPVGDAVAKGGPWLKLGSLLGGSVLQRIALVTNAQKRPAPPQAVPHPTVERQHAPAPQNVVTMPDPSKAGSSSPWHPGDVIAPEPRAMG